MKLVRINTADGETTTHTHDIISYEIQNRNGKKFYNFTTELFEEGYPEALVTGFKVVGDTVTIHVNWD